jgi:FixJ family two-component response regulator
VAVRVAQIPPPSSTPPRTQSGFLMDAPVIFVVDDDASVRRAVRRLVLPLRHPVRLFASAEHFLAHADRDARGCLILDMKLPGISGLQLQQRLSAEGWQLPVVFITAHGNAESRDAALRAGAIDYLAKPFSCERLLQAVAEGLART